MPRYRKLHVKTLESPDFNDMPDDFTRVFWLLLPLILDREGRGRADTYWLKSKVFPARRDVTPERIGTAMTWLVTRGMVVTYEVDRRSYFHVPTFARYQGDTSKESESEYPPPPESVQSESRVSPELVESKSASDTDSYSDSKTNADAGAKSGAGAPLPSTCRGWIDLVNGQKPKEATATLRVMFEQLFPGRDPPDYGFIGSTARTVGGHGRLVQLLWQANAQQPTGDVLRYVLGIHRNRNNGGSGESFSQAMERMLQEEQSGVT